MGGGFELDSGPHPPLPSIVILCNHAVSDDDSLYPITTFEIIIGYGGRRF